MLKRKAENLTPHHESWVCTMDMGFQGGLRLEDTFSLVNGQEFGSQIEVLRATSSRFAINLAKKDSYSHLDCWLNASQTRGFAVGQGGELINVFSAFSVGDNARGILDFAKSQYGALHINCFAGRLETLYRVNGFEEKSRMTNWSGAPNPDVVFMQWRR